MSDRLAIAVDRALDLHWLTAGLFDPTVHDRLVELGYDRTFNRVVKDGDDDVTPGRPALGVAGVERDGSHIRLPLGVRLDLGGIGKGLAADLLAEGMLDRGARSACVSLGGDIRAAGVTPEGRGWQVPVQDPWGSDVIAGIVPLADAAIVTSTTLIRTWRRKGRRIHHLIDPRSGEPATSDVVAAVVVAPEAWLAEGLAKAAIVAGSREAFPMLEGSGAAGWLARADGSLLATSVAGHLVSSESASS
jgi:thiamine biosynthesis lipoprotein